MDVYADQLLERLPSGGLWVRYLTNAFEQHSVGLHLAIFAEPYLSRTLRGEKTIESRFSQVRCAPFETVTDGDILLMKAVSGPICGLVVIKQAWFFDLTHRPLHQIRAHFGDGMCADDDFWATKCDASFASLFQLSDPIAITPLPFQKRDRRGWITLRGRQMTLPI